MSDNIYKNRYGDIFSFTEDADHNILWEGNFEWCRFGMPNDYTKAYKVYLEDNCYSDHCMSLDLFKTEVHKYDDVKKGYVYRKYVILVESLVNEIDMVDPSGGPYISRGMKLDLFGFKDYMVKDFERIDTGYKIITEKCDKCNLAGAIHKMSCGTTKTTILL